jgi:8-oxo-dGTP diphosphatase
VAGDSSEGAPLYARDPASWVAHLEEGNRTQARKRVAAQVIIHDSHERLLLVDPSYKPDWDVPGGMAEGNETPPDAARRELAEELNLDIRLHKLLCVDWVAPHGPWDDLVVFVFDGGVLAPEQVAAMRLHDGELADFGFHPRADAENLLRDYVWRRTRAALEARRLDATAYTHNGHPVFPK